MKVTPMVPPTTIMIEGTLMNTSALPPIAIAKKIQPKAAPSPTRVAISTLFAPYLNSERARRLAPQCLAFIALKSEKLLRFHQ